jgi:hypothetical protein
MKRRTGVIISQARSLQGCSFGGEPSIASPITQDNQEYCALASDLLHSAFQA